MADKRENYDLFPIPRNFGEDGISFNGISRRNLAEGIILAIASGYPMFRFIPASLSLRIILLCFISLPLFFIGLVGMGGESLSQYFATVIRWLFTRRKLRYYIDQGEPEPPKEKGIARIKAIFRKKDKDTLQYKKVRQPKKKKPKRASLFDRFFPSRKTAADQEQEEEAPKSRRIKNQAQTFFPVADIRYDLVQEASSSSGVQPFRPAARSSSTASNSSRRVNIFSRRPSASISIATGTPPDAIIIPKLYHRLLHFTMVG